MGGGEVYNENVEIFFRADFDHTLPHAVFFLPLSLMSSYTYSTNTHGAHWAHMRTAQAAADKVAAQQRLGRPHQQSSFNLHISAGWSPPLPRTNMKLLHLCFAFSCDPQHRVTATTASAASAAVRLSIGHGRPLLAEDVELRLEVGDVDVVVICGDVHRESRGQRRALRKHGWAWQGVAELTSASHGRWKGRRTGRRLGNRR